MPFFSCSVPAVSLTDSQKDDLAKAITRIHSEVAGAAAAITGRSLDTIAVFVRDVPAKYILERGEIVPELGEEDAWLATHERSGAARLASNPTAPRV